MNENEPAVRGTWIKKAFSLADRVLLEAVKWMSLVCFAGLFLLVLANVLVRINPIQEMKVSLHYFDEIQAWLLAAMIFYGAAGLWILRDHFKLDIVSKFLEGKSRTAHAVFVLLVELASCFFIGIFIYECANLLDVGLRGESNFLRIPERVIYWTALFVPGIIMGIYAVRNLFVAVLDLARSFVKKDEAAPPDTPAAPEDGETKVADSAPDTPAAP